MTLPVAPDCAGWWPSDAFHSNEPAFPGPIDITGPPRTLLFGPYLSLAPGLWQAELRFDVCADAARYDYRIDFGTADDFTTCVVRAPRPGAQAATLRHRLGAGALAEVRLWLGRPAFHGWLQLHGARLTRVEPSGLADDQQE